VAQVAFSGLADVHRQITDPFEIGVDLEHRDDRPQIDGHWVMQRDQLKTAIVDLDLQRVAGDHFRELFGVAADERLHDALHAGFSQARHAEQELVELIEFRRHTARICCHSPESLRSLACFM